MRAQAGNAAVALGLVFLAAGVGKLVARDRFRTTLLLSGLVPPRLVPVTRAVLPLLELTVGLLSLSGLLHPLGPVLAAGLLGVFIMRAWPVAASKGSVPCNCFGFTGEFLDAGLLARNGVLMGYALFGIWASPPTLGRLPAPYAPGSLETSARNAIVTACLLLAPFVLAEVVSLWRAAAQVAGLPGLPPAQKAEHP